jgi:hypothetical protein
MSTKSPYSRAALHMSFGSESRKYLTASFERALLSWIDHLATVISRSSRLRQMSRLTQPVFALSGVMANISKPPKRVRRARPSSLISLGGGSS